MVVIQERQLFLLVEPVLSFLSCLFIGQTDKLAILLFYVLRFHLRELLVRSLLAAPLHLSAANGSNRLVHDRAWWVISVLRRLEPTETICWFLLKLVSILLISPLSTNYLEVLYSSFTVIFCSGSCNWGHRLCIVDHKWTGSHIQFTKVLLIFTFLRSWLEHLIRSNTCAPSWMLLLLLNLFFHHPIILTWNILYLLHILFRRTLIIILEGTWSLYISLRQFTIV